MSQFFFKSICLFNFSIFAAVAAHGQTVAVETEAPKETTQVAIAQNYVVVSGHPEATSAGMEVLRTGGNAMDAAVAVSLCLGVAEPYGSGLGGKLVVMFYDAGKRKVECLEALEMSPASLDPSDFLQIPKEEREYGWRSICIPGLPAGLYAAHQRWGTKDFKSLVQPAVELARRGFVVSQQTRDLFRASNRQLKRNPEAARIFAPNGETPDVGTRLVNEDMAASLEIYGEKGSEPFYSGEIAEKLVAAAGEANVPLRLSDFSAYKPEVREPVSADYLGTTIYSSPPPLTGGTTILMTLKALERKNWGAIESRSREHIDAVARVLQQVYPQVTRSIGDVPEARERLKELLSAKNIQEIARAAEKSDPQYPAATLTSDLGQPGDESEASCTTHFVVIDQKGNVVSATQSLNSRFGAGVVAVGTGFPINNGMKNFAVMTRSSPNYIAPAKKPRSTMTPTIVLKNSKALLALGAPAAQRIPTGVLQVIMDVLVFSRNLDQAIEAPRFHLRRPLTKDEPPNLVDLEEGYSPELREALQAQGWQVEPRQRNEFYYGGVNGALRQADGKILGVADSRRTNDAGGE